MMALNAYYQAPSRDSGVMVIEWPQEGALFTSILDSDA